MQLILQRPRERSQPDRIATRRKKKKNERVGEGLVWEKIERRENGKENKIYNNNLMV